MIRVLALCAAVAACASSSISAETPAQEATQGSTLTSGAGKLVAILKKAGADAGYLIRHDRSFPFEAREGGIPMAELTTPRIHAFLFEGIDPKGRPLPQMPTILANAAARRTYSIDLEHSPLAQDYAFIDIGINGVKPLDQFLRASGITEGYNNSVIYVYWPRDWWGDAGKFMSESVTKGQELLWLKIREDGKVISAGWGAKGK